MNGEAYEFLLYTPWRDGMECKKKIQGTTDIPLDEKGIQQAKRLAETLLEKQRNGGASSGQSLHVAAPSGGRDSPFFRGGAGH